jgi:hypothetical protein
MTRARPLPLRQKREKREPDGRNRQIGRVKGLVRNEAERHLCRQDVPSSRSPGAMPPARAPGESLPARNLRAGRRSERRGAHSPARERRYAGW